MSDCSKISSSIESDEDIAAEEATNKADKSEHTPENSSTTQPDITAENSDTLTTEANISSVKDLYEEDSSASETNEDISVSSIDDSELEDVHVEAPESLDANKTTDTTNSDPGDFDISDEIDIEPYLVSYDDEIYGNTNGNSDAQDPSNRVLSNPMYEADVGRQQTADNTCGGHGLQDPSNVTAPLSNLTNRPGGHKPPADPTMGVTGVLKLQADLLNLQPNALYVPNQAPRGLDTQQTAEGRIITFGGFGKQQKNKKNYGKFDSVGGLAMSSTNEIFVSDLWNKRIQVFNMKGDFLRSFPTTKKPRDISIDCDDTLWVIEEGSPNVLSVNKWYSKYNVNHYSMVGRDLGSPGCKAPQRITGIALDSLSDKIIMTTKSGTKKSGMKDRAKAGWFEKDACKVQRFEASELRWLSWPASVAVDKKGDIFIADKERHYVFKHDKNGKYLSCFGRKGAGVDNHLKAPRGICVDSLGRIIVADTGNNRVEMFTAGGEHVRTVAYISRPEHVATGREGQLVVSSKGGHEVNIFPKY
ncbi:TRIM3 [Branchiostoma lanceolatum]|uniref:TRIM3 protein n=1 Tax=Branchiostoma lanceolatum TaxID=7740 RepID=A0A8J9Z8G2_BRALA|nr:TRIM3 [Branchiostoma lanceolatum]